MNLAVPPLWDAGLPDPQLGLVLGPFSMGQLLSAGMVVLGVVLLTLIMRRAVAPVHAPGSG